MNILRFFGLALILCVMTGCYSERPGVNSQSGGSNSAPRAALVGQTAPGFELKDSQGKLHRLENFRGNVLVVHFWASWCPPCLDEIPRWVQMAPRYGSRPVKLIAISIDEKWADALKILPSEGLPSNVISLLDPGGQVSTLYGTTRFPETYLLDANLKVVEKWVGPQDWLGSKVRFSLEKALITSKSKSP